MSDAYEHQEATQSAAMLRNVRTVIDQVLDTATEYGDVVVFGVHRHDGQHIGFTAPIGTPAKYRSDSLYKRLWRLLWTL